MDLFNPAKTYLVVIGCVKRIIFTFLWRTLVSKITQNPTFSIEIPSKCLWETTKTKKSLSAYVCGHKKGFTRRTDIPFASAHAQGPKQVSENLFWYHKWFSKFFHASQVISLRFLRRYFWSFWSHFHQNPFKKWKNRSLRTFRSIKKDSRWF